MRDIPGTSRIFQGGQMVRTIVWREIATAPRDGRIIEVAWMEGPLKGRTPKRTQWVNGEWLGGYHPTHWRTIERIGRQWQGR